MNESQIWNRLKALYPTGQRLEVRMPDGLPDVVINLGGGRAAWIELKQGTRYAKFASWYAPKLTLEQAIWLSQWNRDGGIAGVLIADGDLLAYVNTGFRQLRIGYTECQWEGRLPQDGHLLKVLITGD